jgi:exodeoxyribonuclease VII large subunit
MASLLVAAAQQICGVEKARVQDSARRLELQSPLWRVRNGRQRTDELQARLANNQAHRLELLRSNLGHLQKRLVNLSPQAVLQRGYAIVKTEDGEVVKSVRQVHREDVLDIRVVDGAILSKVLTEPTKENNGGISDD